jgi:hypothetical protein
MKKLLTLFAFTLFLGLMANTNAQAQQANFQFEKEIHDFGNIAVGSDTLWYGFKFKNTGQTPLIISDIRTACDCTLADWSKAPILPGRSGVIKAGFKIKGKNGAFNKTLTITANTSPAMTVLTIKGMIK